MMSFQVIDGKESPRLDRTIRKDTDWLCVWLSIVAIIFTNSQCHVT